jgi:peptidoglycan/LPS O-acetylase OafA/YrhL
VSTLTHRTAGEAFDPRGNSLNVLRLVFATMVIFSHAIGIGLFGRDWIGDRTTIGTVAVYGFFAISGFLIAGSAERNRTGRYLWQRCLRILPAFWVCLIVTAFVIGFVGWARLTYLLHVDPSPGQYFHGPNSPVTYVTNNWFLQIRQSAIHTTEWNGSLWTLAYEFVCYLLLGALALMGLLRRRRVVLGLTGAAWALEALFTVVPDLRAQLGPQTIGVTLYLSLVPLFLTGTLVYLYRDVVPDSGLLALGSSAVFVASLWMPFGGHVPALRPTSTSLLAPAIVLPVLWLGFHLPVRRLAATNDYSYGMYVYAFPVQVLLAYWGVWRWGYVPFAIMGVVATIPLAVGSWWLIERPALRLKKWSPSWGRSLPLPVTDGSASEPPVAPAPPD